MTTRLPSLWSCLVTPARLALFGSALALAACDGTVISDGGELDDTDEADGSSDVSHTTSGGPSGGPGGGVGCSLIGLWDGVSPAYSVIPETRAAYLFQAEGSWLGGDYGSDATSSAFMSGDYSIASSILSLQGAGMTTPGYGYVCDPGGDATFTLDFSADCNTVVINTRTDNCTGARHYLSASEVGSTLVRR